MNVFSTIRDWHVTRKTTKQLNSLSSHQLIDLGLHRVGNKYVQENKSLK